MITSKAAVVRDQGFVPIRRELLSFVGMKAQTFTVGTTGYLHHIDLDAYRELGGGPDETLSWELRRVNFFWPQFDPAGLLAAGSFPMQSIPPRTVFPGIYFPSQGVPVNAGDQLIIILRATNFLYYWVGETWDPYPGGLAVSLHRGTPFPFIDRELGFRTYVETPDVAPICRNASEKVPQPTQRGGRFKLRASFGVRRRVAALELLPSPLAMTQ